MLTALPKHQFTALKEALENLLTFRFVTKNLKGVFVFISEEIVFKLRKIAADGLQASKMIAMLKAETPPEDFNYFFVMAAFREAFGLKMPELSLLERAKCLNGGSFDDEELDALLMAHIKI